MIDGELRELYQEVILDHYKHPRNNRNPDGADRHADGYNPLCGDRISVHVRMDGDRIAEVGFEGSGCAISTASASLMTEALKGRTREEAEALFESFHELVTGGDPGATDLGKLEILAGVREFPARVKCASLAWHTLHTALAGGGEPVTTE